MLPCISWPDQNFLSSNRINRRSIRACKAPKTHSRRLHMLWVRCTGEKLKRYSQEVKTTKKKILATLEKSKNFGKRFNLAHSTSSQNLSLSDFNLHKNSEKRQLEERWTEKEQIQLPLLL